ncbi:MAG: hypothetical protein JSS86_03555 [Cyanobacteria bacterium SZAS LIN-2]|nr:hypothetical protein [Cyanobacteria bacterium SZAS LIN-2]
MASLLLMTTGPCLQAVSAQDRVYIAQYGGDNLDDGDAPPVNRNHKPPPKLLVPGYQTYWSHDAIGYHPCIILALEGDGTTDMTGVPIQLQAQFRVLAEGLLTIGRTAIAFPSNAPHQQIVTQPMQGKRAFELPLDQAEWPVIECKVMAKVGDATSDESQNLLTIPCRVQAVAMSDDDARAQLSFNLGARRPRRADQSASSSNSQYRSNTSTPVAPRPNPDEKPLVAVAGKLGSPIPKPQTKLQEGFEQYMQKTSLPGLGDDFYLFEKALGLPVDTDNRDRDWVWAAYRKHPQVKIFAGSKGRTGKADVVIAAISVDSPLSDSQFAVVARSLSSKFRNEKMAPTEHSVRYTQNGRVELTNLAAQSYRAIYFDTRDQDQSKLAIVAVSRQPGSLSELLKEEGQRTNILHVLLKGLGADGSNP